MSSETEIIQRAEHWFKEKGGLIIQCIYPGSHGGLSVTYTSEDGKRRTIFPDFAVLLGSNPVIAEAKPRFSKSDEKKLIQLATALIGSDAIQSIFERHLGCSRIGNPVYMLIHGDRQATPVPILYQLILPCDSVDGALLLMPLR